MNSKICVMGSFIVDLMGRAPHLPVTGETVLGSYIKIGPGGKGSNQGVAAKRAGGDVTMITKIGNDAFANIALESFKREGMHTGYVFRDETAPTGAALIMVDENTGENNILVAIGACNCITEDNLESARTEIQNCGVLLTQLETNLDAVEKAVQMARWNGAKVVLNTAPAPTKPLSDDILKHVHILTPNEVEASIISGVEVNSPQDAVKAAKKLMSKGVESVIVTLGARGCTVVTDAQEEYIPGVQVEAVDTTGAGDAFNGGLAAALAEGLDIIQAARFANVVGALSVTKIGTAPSMPYRREIDQLMETLS